MLEAPLEGTPVVFYYTALQTRSRFRGGSTSSRLWKNIWSERKGVPFLISDGKDRMVLRPTKALVMGHRTNEIEGRYGKYWKRLAELDRRHGSGIIGILSGIGSSGKVRRCTESSLTLGEHVYAHGRVVPYRGGSEGSEIMDVTLTHVDDKEPFVISSQDEGHLRAKFYIKGALWLFAAILWSSFPIIPLLFYIVSIL